jgi:hypothetical protein
MNPNTSFPVISLLKLYLPVEEIIDLGTIIPTVTGKTGVLY